MSNKEMTSQEFFAKYGSMKVKFESYSKYTFNYSIDLPNGKTLTCTYTGDNNDIYHHEVSVDTEITVDSLRPFCGYVTGKAYGIEEGFYEQ